MKHSEKHTERGLVFLCMPHGSVLHACPGAKLCGASRLPRGEALRGFTLHDRRWGQSLVEILVSIAVGSILVLGAVPLITPALKGSASASQIQASTAAARQLLDNVRSATDSNWHSLFTLATGTSNKYYLFTAASPFVVQTGTESVVPDVLDGLVGYWKLDETTSTRAYDFSGNVSHGTSTGSVTATSTCRTAGCFDLDGSSGYVDIGTGFTDGIEASGTIAAWVYRQSGTGGIFTRSSGSGASDERLVVYFRGDNETWGWALANGAANQTVAWASSTFPANQWVHVALTWNGSTAVTYLDGRLFDSRSQTVTPDVTGQKTRLGWTEGLSTAYFDGKLDEVRVYNRTLTASEVAQLARAVSYTRYFYVEDAYRDGSGNVAASGSYDPSTKGVTVVFGWSGGPTSSFSTYLTRWRSRASVQTDWAGGASGTEPVSGFPSQFSSSTGIDYATTTGSLRVDGF